MLLHRNCQTSLFELVIRGVGGLLSAYDLSQDSIFLTRCRPIPCPAPCSVLLISLSAVLMLSSGLPSAMKILKKMPVVMQL